MNSVVSHSVAETQALGEEWGRAVQRGLLIGLTGDLGAGKTHLVKGLAIGLGIKDKISSPTFALVNEYEQGRIPMFHIDLYRLETREQIVGAGLEDYFYQSRGVVVVEWIERWLPTASLLQLERPMGRVRLVKVDQLTETTRRISYEDFGA